MSFKFFRIILEMFNNFAQYLFYTRNSLFQILYLFIVCTFHSAIIYDGLAILRLADPDSYHLPLPLFICFLNVCTFLTASYTNPGIITHKNVNYLVRMYKYDDVIFKQNEMCPTCKLTKPARSKHCKITGLCIYKFDHYCIWISNSIGGYNHRYFLLLLFTLAIMLINGIYNIFKVLRALGQAFHLWELADYKMQSIISQGDAHSWSNSSLHFGLIYSQIMFNRFPRVVFILISCLIILAIELYFLIYHLASAFKNETTNESYKRYYHLKAAKINSNSAKSSEQALKPCKNIYNKSLWANIMEELFPPYYENCLKVE